MSREAVGPASVLGLIPARGGSKGVKDKNIVPVGGRPLISYTIEAARKSRLLGDCIVSTDSRAIAEISKEWGGKVPFLRPAALATDEAGSIDVALHALDTYDPDGKYEYLFLLQPTSPFRNEEDIDRSIELAYTHRAASVVSFTCEESRHPYYMYFVKSWPGAGERQRVVPAFDYKVGTPRQEFPAAAYRNGAVYLALVSYMREARSFVSGDLVPYFMPAERSLNIDGELDVKYAEFLISSGSRSQPSL